MISVFEKHGYLPGEFAAPGNVDFVVAGKSLTLDGNSIVRISTKDKTTFVTWRLQLR
jgi:hypothetical protein